MTASRRPEPFEEFYQREYQRGVHLAWLITRSTPAAEDLVQDAMLSVHTAFERLDSPGGYLNRAILYRGRTWRRDQARDRERFERLARERPPISADDADLFEAIGALPYRQQVVLIARYWLGWSERETADFLQSRIGTVKSLTSRAISQLRTTVRGE